MTASTQKKKLILIFVFILITALVTGILVFSLKSSKPTVNNSRAATKTSVEQHIYRPTLIDYSSTEIINSQRGFYKWRGQEVVPMITAGNHDNTTFDTYDRLTWDQLESDTVPGDYSKGIALINTKAAEAKSKGGKFSFRIYVFCPDCDDTEDPSGIIRQVPAYIGNRDKQGTYNGWYLDNERYIPDWNNENFLNRVDKLLEGLGNAFRDDNRIGTIDIGIYGMWGEFHMFCIYPDPDPNACKPDQTPPSGITNITTANLHRIIDMHINRFNTKRLVALVHEEAITYTAGKTTQAGAIGWRGDCLGLEEGNDRRSNGDILNSIEHFRRLDGSLGGAQGNRWAAIWNAGLKDRWQVAPITVEGCPFYAKKWKGNKELNDIEAAYNQVIDYHVSQVGNGNVKRWNNGSITTSGDPEEKWNSFTETLPSGKNQQELLKEIGKRAGFRYKIDELSLPQVIGKTESFNINSKWLNIGNAPIYEDWEVWVQLKNTITGELWETKSSVNLKTIFNTGTTNTVFNIADSTSIPLSVTNGLYSVGVIVREPPARSAAYPNYRLPLFLSQQGRQADGSYLLGTQTVQVVDPDVTPSVTTTISPTFTVSPTSTILPTVQPTSTVLPTSVPTSIPTRVPTPTSSRPQSSITITTRNGSIFSTLTPNIQGRTTPNSAVEISIPLLGITQVVTSDASGNFSYTLSNASEGTYTVIATLLDQNGVRTNYSASITFTINLNSTLPDSGVEIKWFIPFAIILILIALFIPKKKIIGWE